LIFFKYQGLGNDFIVLEDFDGRAPQDPAFAIRWCDRRFGRDEGGAAIEGDEAVPAAQARRWRARVSRLAANTAVRT